VTARVCHIHTIPAYRVRMTTDTDHQGRATDQGERPAAAHPAVSPWLTLREAAAYVRRSYETARRACVEYQRTDGRYGLKCTQGRPGTKILVLPADAVRWASGLKPEQ
jgi:hypothetical protein